jgi:hypothetical protein
VREEKVAGVNVQPGRVTHVTSDVTNWIVMSVSFRVMIAEDSFSRHTAVRGMVRGDGGGTQCLLALMVNMYVVGGGFGARYIHLPCLYYGVIAVSRFCEVKGNTVEAPEIVALVH